MKTMVGKWTWVITTFITKEDERVRGRGCISDSTNNNIKKELYY